MSEDISCRLWLCPIPYLRSKKKEKRKNYSQHSAKVLKYVKMNSASGNLYCKDVRLFCEILYQPHNNDFVAYNSSFLDNYSWLPKVCKKATILCLSLFLYGLYAFCLINLHLQRHYFISILAVIRIPQIYWDCSFHYWDIVAYMDD